MPTDAADLAARLLALPVTPDRIAKLKKHITSQAHYDAIRAALPEDVRAAVTLQLGAYWKGR